MACLSSVRAQRTANRRVPFLSDSAANPYSVLRPWRFPLQSAAQSEPATALGRLQHRRLGHCMQRRRGDAVPQRRTRLLRRGGASTPRNVLSVRLPGCVVGSAYYRREAVYFWVRSIVKDAFLKRGLLHSTTAETDLHDRRDDRRCERRVRDVGSHRRVEDLPPAQVLTGTHGYSRVLRCRQPPTRRRPAADSALVRTKSTEPPSGPSGKRKNTETAEATEADEPNEQKRQGANRVRAQWVGREARGPHRRKAAVGVKGSGGEAPWS